MKKLFVCLFVLASALLFPVAACAQSLTPLVDTPSTIYGAFASYHQTSANHVDGGVFFAKLLNSKGTYSSNVLTATGGGISGNCQILSPNCTASTSFKSGVEQVFLQDGRFSVSGNGDGGLVTGGASVGFAWDAGLKAWLRIGAQGDSENFIGVYPHYEYVSSATSANSGAVVMSLIFGRGKR